MLTLNNCHEYPLKICLLQRLGFLKIVNYHENIKNLDQHIYATLQDSATYTVRLNSHFRYIFSCQITWELKTSMEK